MTGFESPNYTQTPNELFDRYLSVMGEAELRVVLWAVRQTLGYHIASDEISLTQFEKATGLSRQGVIDGLAAAIERGIIQEVGTGKRGVKCYALVILVDQSTEQTSQASRPDDQARTSQASRHTKEKKEKDSSPDGGKRTNEWYDAIFAIWKYTGAMNGAMQKMLQGTSKRKGWQEYNLSIPLASAEELLKWARWYRATQLGGRSDLNMLEERLKIQSSIHYWQTIAGMPDAPAKPAQDTLFSDAPVPADDFDTMLKFMGVK